MKRELSLKRRLLLQFLLAGIIPMVAVAAISYKVGSKTIEELSYDRLESTAQSRKNAIESYFKTVENQIATLSQDDMVVQAAKSLTHEFNHYTDSMSEQAVKDMKSELSQYYREQFAAEYQKQNGKAVDAVSALDKLDANGIALQYWYIQENPNPLGSKLALNSAKDQSEYSQIHEKLHPILRDYLTRFGFYEIFIADPETGNIVYTVFKELDFGTSLKSGPYANTAFAKAFAQAAASNNRDDIAFVDFEPYRPSYDAPASFIGSPIYDGDKKVGVLLFQLPLDRISAIMGERMGLGDTGESYLVGADHLLRSDTFLDKDNFSVVSSFRNPDKYNVKTTEVEEALKGSSGSSIDQNYLGHQVISTYTPVSVLNKKWALLTQINTSEAFGPIKSLGITVGVIAIIALALVSVWATLIGRRIATPILNIASQLESNSQKVMGASTELSVIGGQLSESVAEQASSLEETAASIEQISAMVKNNVEQAERSSGLSENVRTTAHKGNDAMDQLLKSMSEIIASNQNIQDLVQVIGEIGEKTEIIDEIVFQTKLLSFNASVEAERAGEYGRGFAVVAQEVGNLAQMSGKAALEISAMVKNSIKNASAITSENKKKVEHGNGLVQEVAKHLGAIAKDAEILAKQAQQIATASKEQSEGIGQINEAMSQLDQATQQNSSGAQQTASASEQLRSQADELKDNVITLVNLIEGQGNPQKSVAAQKSQKATSAAPKNIVTLKPRQASNQGSAPARELKMASGADISPSAEASDNWEKL